MELRFFFCHYRLGSYFKILECFFFKFLLFKICIYNWKHYSILLTPRCQPHRTHVRPKRKKLLFWHHHQQQLMQLSTPSAWGAQILWPDEHRHLILCHLSNSHHTCAPLTVTSFVRTKRKPNRNELRKNAPRNYAPQNPGPKSVIFPSPWDLSRAFLSPKLFRTEKHRVLPRNQPDLTRMLLIKIESSRWKKNRTTKNINRQLQLRPSQLNYNKISLRFVVSAPREMSPPSPVTGWNRKVRYHTLVHPGHPSGETHGTWTRTWTCANSSRFSDQKRPWNNRSSLLGSRFSVFLGRLLLLAKIGRVLGPSKTKEDSLGEVHEKKWFWWTWFERRLP